MPWLNPFVSKFIGDVLGYIRYQKVHPSIRYELEDHIESLKACYIEEGLDENEAYEKAVLQMGEAESIGKALNKTHKPKLEWSVLLLMFAIVSIGLFALYCADSYEIQNTYTRIYVRQLVFVGFGVGALIGAYFFDYRYLDRWAIPIYLLGIGLLLYGQHFGMTVNGATRWIKLGPFNVSIPQVVLAILMLSYIGIVRRLGNDQIKNYLGLGIIAGVPLFILMQISMMSAVLLGICFLLVLTFHINSRNAKKSKIKLLSILYSIVVGSGALVFMYMLRAPYRMDRFKVMFNPESDPLGSGYMAVQMKAVRESASLIGNKGFKVTPVGYLPEPTNDIIFTFILGSMGWLIGAFLILCIAVVIIRMFKASTKIRDNYGKMVSLSIATLFAVQFVYNIAMNLGYIPIIGIPLPFVSYGGSGMVINFALMGVFLSVYRKKDLVELAV